MELKKLRCPTCGAEIDSNEIDFSKKIGRCNACYGTFVIEQAENFAKVEVDKTKDVEAYRNNLATSVEKDDAIGMIRFAGQILDILPDDFEATYFYAYAYAKRGDSRYLYDFYQDVRKEYTEESAMRVAEHVVKRCDLRDEKRALAFLRSLHYESDSYVAFFKDTFAERVKKEELYDDITRDVFICHRSTNTDAASRIVKVLEEDGNTCWISTRNLRPNDNENYWTNIKKAIKSCRIFLVVSSRDAMFSGDVKKEMAFAKDLNKRRIEVKIDESEHNAFFKDFFDGCKWIKGENYDEIKSRVADLVSKALAGNNGVVVRKVEKVRFTPIREAEQPTAKIVLDEFHKHEFVKGEVVPPTCKEPGFTIYRCECGEMKKSDFTARRPEHDFVLAEKKEPTCTDDGYVKYECRYCDATKTDVIPALGHDFKLTEEKPSTCKDTGYRIFTCTKCGEKKPESLPIVPHSYGEWIKTKYPTCEDDGEETRQCSFCGKKETRPIASTGHNYGKWFVKSEATCGHKGIKVRRCLACGKAEESEIAAKGHTFGDWYTLPTDVTKDERICKECGYSETRLKADVREKRDKISSLIGGISASLLVVLLIVIWAIFFNAEYHFVAAVPILSGILALAAFIFVTVIQAKRTEKRNKAAIGIAIFAVIVTGGLLAGVISHTALTAKAVVKNNVIFVENSDGYKVVGKLSSGNSVKISPEVNGKSVTEIGEKAFAESGDLIEITIPSSVTRVADDAFLNCSIERAIVSAAACAHIRNEKLKEVIVTGGEKIGYKAFQYCTLLESVIMSDTIKEIDSAAFEYCDALKSVTIPDSVTKIGSYAFNYCEKLESITIGKRVEAIGDNAFSNCKALKRVNHTGNLATWSNIAFSTSESNPLTKAGLFYINDELIRDITFPKTVTAIRDYAFNGWSGNSVVIPSSVTFLGLKAFGSCPNLTHVEVESDINDKYQTVFNDCPITSAKIPTSFISVLPKENLETVELTSGIGIGQNAFKDCYNLRSVTLPESLISIEENAFYGCVHLVEVYNKSSLQISKGSKDFGYVGYYADTIYSNGEESKLSTDENDFTVYENGGKKILIDYAGKETKLVLPDGITEIRKRAFSENKTITSIVVPRSVEKIEEGSFYGCSALESITIPFIGVEKEGTDGDREPFGCIFGTEGYELATATQQWYRNPTTGNEVEATYYIPSALKNVTVTGGDILYGAFYNCRTLRQITLSDEVGLIESGAFIGCSSLQYNEYENGLYLGSETNPYLLLVQAKSTDITTCEVNRQTKFIHEGAFFGCKVLKNLVIPDSVTDIGDNLLRDCLVLEFNEYDNAYYLGNAENPCVILVKAKDTNITSCSVNEKTRFIYKEAFQFCSELTELSIPESVLGIGSSAFSGCVKLKNVNIPTKCKAIKQYTFSNCGLIEDIVIPDSVETIEKGAFFNCDSLMSVTFGKNVTMIGEEAFQECAFLTTVTLNPKVMKIGDNAFKWCARLASITIPITVKEIGAYAFRYCNNFTDVIYEGTKEQWKAFRKENYWDSDTGSYTVHCKDGDLSK